MPNKGNIEPVKMERFYISTSKVTEYLQEQLGFPVAVDYTRWTGVSQNFNYVRMRVGIRYSDIVAEQTTSTDYATRQINANSQMLPMKGNVVNALKQYMYLDMDRITQELSNEDVKKKFYLYGLHSDRLLELIKFSKLTYIPSLKMWRVYLRPEEIIRDMLSDPTTGAVDGQLDITGVFGTDSDTIRWEVEIRKDSKSVGDMGVVSMEKLFQVQQ